MQVTPMELPEVLLVEPKVFGDARGFFMETWSQQRYHESGLTESMVSENPSAQSTTKGSKVPPGFATPEHRSTIATGISWSSSV